MSILLDTHSKVAGVTFPNENGEDVQEILRNLQRKGVGDGILLRFEREPDNPHDENAIKIYVNETTNIGHMTRQLAKTVAPLMDSGCSVHGHIKEITGGGDLSYGCNYTIMVLSPVAVKPPVQTVQPQPTTPQEVVPSKARKTAWLVLGIIMIPVTIMCYAMNKVFGAIMLLVTLYSFYRWHNYEKIILKESSKKPVIKSQPSRTVYITSNGKKYHYRKDCLGNNFCTCISESQAVNCGLSKCSKCCH